MKSTTVYVPSSELGIWDSPNPSPASECALPHGPKVGGARSPAAKGVGESQFRRLEKKLSTLPTLCSGCLSKEKEERNKCRRDCKTKIIFSADWTNIVQKYACRQFSFLIYKRYSIKNWLFTVFFLQELRFPKSCLQFTPKLFFPPECESQIRLGYFLYEYDISVSVYAYQCTVRTQSTQKLAVNYYCDFRVISKYSYKK